MKMPQTVQTAIKAYQEEKAKTETAAALHRESANRLRAELDDVRAQLAAAEDKTFSDPSEENVQHSVDLQRKISELEMAITTAEERERSVHSKANGRITALADEAIEIARAEALRHFTDNYDARLKAIEEAKNAYLRALVDLRSLHTEAYDIWTTAGRETNANRLERASKPHFPELTLNWRGGDRQVYGVNELEVTRAYRDGKIRRTSVAPGREIE